jgi:hypothetical protein
MSTLTTQQNDSALASLAILKVNFDLRQDYVSNFIPFVAEVLRARAPEAVSLSDLQRGVEDMFGLRVPQGALSTILRRAARKRLVQVSHGTYRPNLETLGGSDFADLRAEAGRQEADLVQRLANHAGCEYGVGWSADQAESALLHYVDGRTVDLFCGGHRSALVSVGAPLDHNEVIVASFVKSLAGTDPQGFEFFLSVVKGVMLANVLYLPGGFAEVDRRFGPTTFFLDTAFVLRATGFASAEIAAPCRELIELLQSLSAKLGVFEHTVSEIEGALEGSIRGLRGDSDLAGPAEFLIHDGWSPSDVEEFRARLPSKLAALGIEVISRPAYTERLGIDEIALEQTLKYAMPRLRSEGLRRDVESLSAVHRLRGGHLRNRLESADAILVTTNGALARAGADFFREQHAGDGSVPWCIHAHTLTTLAWLKQPANAPDLPRLQVIADSYAALRPPDALWQKYRAEIDRLHCRGAISVEDCHLLRYSDEARRALMLATMGDADVFTEGTVAQVLDRAYANARAATEESLVAERAARADEAAAVASELAELSGQAKEQIRHHEEVARVAESRADRITDEFDAVRLELDRERERRLQQLDRLADLGSRAVSLGAWLALTALLLLAACTQVAEVRDVVDSVPALSPLAAGVVFLLGFAGLVSGTSAKSIRRPVEVVMRPRIRRLLAHLIDATGSSSDEPGATSERRAR